MEKTSLPEPSSKTITALVVDDEGCTRMVHRMLLSRQGIEAVLAENGKEAATKELRNMGIRCFICGVSGGSSGESKEDFKESGMDLYQQKPLNAQKLAFILQKLKNDG
ncbi:hypothetical protein FH972_002521 [Carpinus fangiana]|uniref:Response regulatory domain-containing protein n=1 Tax=Carpinus fangiana TaxID=176857 RepID=A0A5N6QI82_9ROSI|nr:hypothetical protein FH972_002521 [Carpinus fangiana]